MAVTSGGGGRRRKTMRRGPGGVPDDLLENIQDQIANRGSGARSRSFTPGEFGRAQQMPMPVSRTAPPGIEHPMHQVEPSEKLQGIMATLAEGISPPGASAPPVGSAISTLASSLPEQIPEMDENRRRILRMLAQQFNNPQTG